MSLGQKIAERRQKQARIIEVSEWGDDGAPLHIHVYPLTAGDINKIQKKHKNFLNDMTIEGMIDLIILKAGNADGERLFTLADKTHLMDEPLPLISDIASQMFGDIEGVEEAEKN
jgi:hypothetical protein